MLLKFQTRILSKAIREHHKHSHNFKTKTFFFISFFIPKKVHSIQWGVGSPFISYQALCLKFKREERYMGWLRDTWDSWEIHGMVGEIWGEVVTWGGGLVWPPKFEFDSFLVAHFNGWGGTCGGNPIRWRCLMMWMMMWHPLSLVKWHDDVVIPREVER